MRKIPVTNRIFFGRQGGAALIVSLTFLFVVTLLGVTAMQTSALEEKMAGNYRDANLAFQAAEAALRDAEADIPSRVTGLTGFDSSCSNGLCDATSGLSEVWEDTTKEANGVAFGTYTGATSLDTALVGCQPRYWIEGFRVWPAGSPSWKPRYRITVEGCGANSNTRVRLQTVYSP